MEDPPVSHSRARRLLNRIFGDRGERTAAKFVRRLGYRILTKGYRTSAGEVDLIAIDGRTLVFIEVKTRRSGLPAEAVTPEKQRKLTLAALHFLKRHRLLEHPSRFDVLAILWPEDQREPQVTHYRNAFPAVGRDQLHR